MKKFTLVFSMLVLFMIHVQAQETIIAGWTFPGSSPLADTGTMENLDKEISTMGGTSELEFKNGFSSKAAQATSWNDGANQKAWVIHLSTLGYTDLNISSRQQSGGNDAGPKYFMLQYSSDGGTIWIDINDGAIVVENDWETSFVEKMSLPEECNDLDELMIRWLMTSEESSAGGNVLENGKSKIDEIFIRGEIINGNKEIPAPVHTVFASKSTGSIVFRSEQEIEYISISTLDGKSEIINVHARSIAIKNSLSRSGSLLIYRIKWKNNSMIYSGKIFLP